MYGFTHNFSLHESHATLGSIFVKQKKRTMSYRDYTIRLQGVFLFAVIGKAAELKMEPSDFIREAIESRLVDLGALPSWWYTRKVGIVRG